MKTIYSRVTELVAARKELSEDELAMIFANPLDVMVDAEQVAEIFASFIIAGIKASGIGVKHFVAAGVHRISIIEDFTTGDLAG